MFMKRDHKEMEDPEVAAELHKALSLNTKALRLDL